MKSVSAQQTASIVESSAASSATVSSGSTRMHILPNLIQRPCHRTSNQMVLVLGWIERCGPKLPPLAQAGLRREALWVVSQAVSPSRDSLLRASKRLCNVAIQPSFALGLAAGPGPSVADPYPVPELVPIGERSRRHRSISPRSLHTQHPRATQWQKRARAAQESGELQMGRTGRASRRWSIGVRSSGGGRKRSPTTTRRRGGRHRSWAWKRRGEAACPTLLG